MLEQRVNYSLIWIDSTFSFLHPPLLFSLAVSLSFSCKNFCPLYSFWRKHGRTPPLVAVQMCFASPLLFPVHRQVQRQRETDRKESWGRGNEVGPPWGWFQTLKPDSGIYLSIREEEKHIGNAYTQGLLLLHARSTLQKAMCVCDFFSRYILVLLLSLCTFLPTFWEEGDSDSRHFFARWREAEIDLPRSISREMVNAISMSKEKKNKFRRSQKDRGESQA